MRGEQFGFFVMSDLVFEHENKILIFTKKSFFHIPGSQPHKRGSCQACKVSCSHFLSLPLSHSILFLFIIYFLFCSYGCCS